MKILFLNQFYAPAQIGTAIWLTDLAEDLVRAGHDVTVLCGDRSYPEPDPIPLLSERIQGVVVERVRMTGFGRKGALGRVVDAAAFIAGAALRVSAMPQPDVVISLTSPPMIPVFGLAVARLRSARFCNWVMDLYPDVAVALGVLHRDSLTARAARALSRFVLRRSDRVVALGGTMARRLADEGARRIEVVHEWVDGGVIRPRPREDHPLRAAWGWRERFVVLYSGIMGRVHEFQTALAAAERLQDAPEVLFAFIGAGASRDEVEEEARVRRIRNVEFRPLMPRDQLGESLTTADLHLLTLRNEVAGTVLPAKIYGILASGRPCVFVGPSECEVVEFLETGRCGRRVAVGDVEGLVAAIRTYLADRETRVAEGDRARGEFERRFDRPVGLRAFRSLVAGLEQPNGA